MTDDCIFCKIARGDAPADMVYQDDRVSAFRDINPLANTHVLVIPNGHFDSLNDASRSQDDLLAHALKICVLVAQDEGIDEQGYRVVTNIGENGGQDVPHLHFHVIGGQKLGGSIG